MQSREIFTGTGWDFVSETTNGEDDYWHMSPLNNGFPGIFDAIKGEGTRENPYLIEDIDDLVWISKTEDLWEGGIYFVQTKDIDASGTDNLDDGYGDSYGFDPIGNTTTYFSGYYDGQNHVIDGLVINRRFSDIGLFGYIEGNT